MNRNKSIDLLIGNIANVVLHEILENAIEDELIRNHYEKEIMHSLIIAKKYRKMINPVDVSLPEKDIKHIKDQIMKRVKSALMLRISKGYQNLKIESIEEITDKFLKQIKVT